MLAEDLRHFQPWPSRNKDKKSQYSQIAFNAGKRTSRRYTWLPEDTLVKNFVLFLVLLVLAATQASAGLITNGDFEAGLTGWTVTNEAGGSGNWFSQTGTTSPTSGFAVPAPPELTHAAMTDQGGPGSHVLIQSFVVPAGITSVDIGFLLFIGNRAGAFSTPSSLDYAVNPNQQARVDLLTATATPFDLAPADIVANLYQTHVGDPLVSGYNPFSFTISGLTPGNTYQLRFAEADNQTFFQMGVDSVGVNASVPEPATFGLAGAVGLGLALLRLRRRMR